MSARLKINCISKIYRKNISNKVMEKHISSSKATTIISCNQERQCFQNIIQVYFLQKFQRFEGLTNKVHEILKANNVKSTIRLIFKKFDKSKTYKSTYTCTKSNIQNKVCIMYRCDCLFIRAKYKKHEFSVHNSSYIYNIYI